MKRLSFIKEIHREKERQALKFYIPKMIIEMLKLKDKDKVKITIEKIDND